MKKRTKKKPAKLPFDWRSKFQPKITSAEDATAIIKPGQRVFIGTGCAAPLNPVHALTDRVVDLVEAGVVTGKYKTLDPGKVVASFCLGSKNLYDFIDDNPAFSFQPTEYVNDPCFADGPKPAEASSATKWISDRCFHRLSPRQLSFLLCRSAPDTHPHGRLWTNSTPA
jgi:acyl-CoA hydrolase